jgi:hypothetical protein
MRTRGQRQTILRYMTEAMMAVKRCLKTGFPVVPAAVLEFTN